MLSVGGHSFSESNAPVNLILKITPQYPTGTNLLCNEGLRSTG